MEGEGDMRQQAEAFRYTVNVEIAGGKRGEGTRKTREYDSKYPEFGDLSAVEPPDSPGARL